MKKFLILSLVFILLSSSLVSGEEIRVSARTAIAIDADSKIVLFEKNGDNIVSIASTTKILTAMVAIKYGDLDKKIDISSRSAGIRGSTVGYKKGEKISLKELLYGLMLRSGNDAAIAVAENVSGSVDNFVKLMNEYAVEIGLSNSHFAVPHGLDDEQHYSSAYDLAVITAKAKESEIFSAIVNTKDLDAKQYGFTRSYHNINKILWLIKEADGVKTGYTGDAGKCLVTSLKLQDRNIVIVVLNCTERWSETKKIFDYISKNFQYKKFYSKNQMVLDVEVPEGKNKVRLSSEKDIILPIKNGSNYEIKASVADELKAPIKIGDRIGSFSLYENGKIIYTQELISLDASAKKHKFFNIVP